MMQIPNQATEPISKNSLMRGGCLPVMVVTLCSVFCSDGSGAEAATARAEAAIEQYQAAMECQDRVRRQQLFSHAEQLFQQILDGDASHRAIRNADLYVCLGNAALQAEQLGPAIAAYRRALTMDPQHAPARQNLAYTRSLIPDWIRYDNRHALIDTLFFWRSLWTVSQLQICAALCFLLAAVLVATGIVRNQNGWRHLAVMPLIAWAVILASLFLNPDEMALHNGIVLQELPVYTADSANAPPRLSKPIPSGAELKLIQGRDRWSEVELPDGRTGWVLSSGIAVIGDHATAPTP